MLIEKLTQTLEIKDPEESEDLPSPSLHLSMSSEPNVSMTPGHHGHTVESLTHHIEVQVLESGQVAMSSATATCDLLMGSAPVVTRNSLTALHDTQAAPPPISSSTMSKKGKAATARRRQPSSSKATQEDQVEVDGQFDMPIPDSSTSETTSTGTNTVMTFVMTSEGLSQAVPAVPAEQDKQQQQPGIVNAVGQQTASSLKPPHKTQGSIETPPTSRKEQVKHKVSVDVSTQTTNGKLRSEMQDRTPLIIRRSRAGKGHKVISPSTKQQSVVPIAGAEVTKSVELSTGNGNETRSPTCQEVQVQTQSPPGNEMTHIGTQVTETVANEPREQVSPQTPRRSTRKSAHKVSPNNEATAIATSSQTQRISPRKSPVQNANLASPQIRTRAAAKRTGLEEQSEEHDAPPAKRTRKAVQQKSSDTKHPQKWGVNEVAEFISSFQSDCTEVFKEHVSVCAPPLPPSVIHVQACVLCIVAGGGR